MKHLFAIILTPFILLACENTTFVSSIPSYPVAMRLNITAEYPHFVPDNGYQALSFTQQHYPTEALGYGGLLVWTAYDGLYHAADLCCPNCINPNTPLQIDGINAHCPICGEDYELPFKLGFPTLGIANERLRIYKAFRSGDYLIISN